MIAPSRPSASLSRRACLLALAGAAACRATGGKKSPLRLPLIVPVSGDFAEFGRTEVAAAELAAGGLCDGARPIELEVRDSEHRAGRGLELFEELWRAEPFGFCYAASSDVALALAPPCRERGVLLLSDAANPKVAAECPLAFRHCPDAVTESRTLVHHAVAVLGARRLALAHVRGAYGESYAGPLGEAARDEGAELVAREEFEQAREDFAALVATLLASRPDAVVCIGLGPSLAHLVAALRAAPFAGPILAAASIAYPGAYTVAPEACEGVLFADVWLDEDSPACREFVARYRAAEGVRPSPLAAMAFDAFSLLFDAMQAGGYDPRRSAELLATRPLPEGACGRIRLGAERQLLFELRMLVLAGGVPRRA